MESELIVDCSMVREGGTGIFPLIVVLSLLRFQTLELALSPYKDSLSLSLSFQQLKDDTAICVENSCSLSQ